MVENNTHILKKPVYRAEEDPKNEIVKLRKGDIIEILQTLEGLKRKVLSLSANKA